MAPPCPLLAVPNVTTHPSTASVPITVLLYDGPLLCGLNVAMKGLSILHQWCSVYSGIVHYGLHLQCAASCFLCCCINVDVKLRWCFIESDQESSNGTPVKQSTASTKQKIVSLKKKESM